MISSIQVFVCSDFDFVNVTLKQSSCVRQVQGSYVDCAKSSSSDATQPAYSGLFIAAHLSDKPILGSCNDQPAQTGSDLPSKTTLQRGWEAIPDTSMAAVLQILLHLATGIAVIWVWVLEVAQALLVLTVPTVCGVIATALGFLTSPDLRIGVKWCLAEGLPGQSYARWPLHLARQTWDCVIHWLNTVSSAMSAKTAGFTEVVFACHNILYQHIPANMQH